MRQTGSSEAHFVSNTLCLCLSFLFFFSWSSLLGHPSSPGEMTPCTLHVACMPKPDILARWRRHPAVAVNVRYVVQTRDASSGRETVREEGRVVRETAGSVRQQETAEACGNMQVPMASSDDELVWNEDDEEPLDVDGEEHIKSLPRDLRLRSRGASAAGRDEAPNDELLGDDGVMLRLRGDGAVDGDESERPAGPVDDDLLRLRRKGLRGGGGGGGDAEELVRRSSLGLRESFEEAAEVGRKEENEAVRARGPMLRAFDEVRRVGIDVAEGR
jgi:hypothetical protein